jgi:hypothetical protein
VVLHCCLRFGVFPIFCNRRFFNRRFSIGILYFRESLEGKNSGECVGRNVGARASHSGNLNSSRRIFYIKLLRYRMGKVLGSYLKISENFCFR